jgi:hypothetical protein
VLDEARRKTAAGRKILASAVMVSHRTSSYSAVSESSGGPMENLLVVTFSVTSWRLRNRSKC